MKSVLKWEIKEELYSHLKEKATEYLNYGKNENEALKLAINEMGSSKHIGQELNELHKSNSEWSITLLCITLVLLGIGTMYFFQINGSFEKEFGAYMTGSLYSFFIYGIALIIVSYISKAPKKVLGSFAIIEALILFLTKFEFNIIGLFITNRNDLNNSSYIHDQLKIIRDSSVLIGKAENFNKNGLPNFYSEYMFSYIVYNFGWIAGFIIILLLTALLIKIYKISKNIKNNYGSTLIIGIASILGIQFIWHVLSNLGFINGNVPLPFISYGGTAIVFNMFIIGIIINVYKGRSISRIELT